MHVSTCGNALHIGAGRIAITCGEVEIYNSSPHRLPIGKRGSVTTDETATMNGVSFPFPEWEIEKLGAIPLHIGKGR